MITKEAVVKSESGIHARPALDVVKEATKFKAEVIIIKEGNEYNAKSILGIMTIGAVKNDVLTIKAIGEDEEDAVNAMVDLIENRLK